MGYLIDTNVLSEMRKADRGNPAVRAWATRTRTNDLFLSVLVVGEIRRGVESVRRTDAAQAAVLDGLFAATAMVHGLDLVTRNTGDVARTGVRVINPFEPLPGL